MHMTRHFFTLLFLLAAAAAPAGAQAPVLTPPVVGQGELVRVHFPLPGGRQVKKATLTFAGSAIPCFVRGEQVVGLFAVSAKTRPGKYAPVLTVQYEDGAPDQATLPLVVKARSFPTQRIRMAKSKTGLMSNAILDKERDILSGAMAQTAPEPLWAGVFANPLSGRISSPFGRKRYVNSRFWGQHSGLDVASPAGRPVRAANNGRILIAQKLWMRGNTVMIDHGMGVFSLYNHLSRLDVQPGEKIRKGETIGRVGATGFATGPHLHWELRIQQTPTDPAGPLHEGIPLFE